MSNNTLDVLSSKKDKDEKLIQILQKLSNAVKKDDNLAKELQHDFELVYCDSYRHSYSSVTKYLLTTESDTGDKWDNLENIVGSLDWIISTFSSHNENVAKDVLIGVIKLRDHINLEVVRVNFLKYRDDGVNTQINDLRSSINQAKDYDKQLEDTILKLEKFNKHWTKIEEDLASQKTQHITILGIFASIVFTVFSGFGFVSSAFSSINQVNIFKLSYLCCLTGAIIFSIIIGLCWFISVMSNIKVHNKLIYWFIAIVYASFAFGIYYFFDRSLSYF